MALQSLNDLKADLDTAAAALNDAFEDSAFPGEMSEIIRHPGHDLRDIGQLFILDGDGQFTTDSNYVDLAYSGVTHSSSKNQRYVVPDMTLVTATIEDAAPADIVLTFNRGISATDSIVLGGESKTIDTITIVSNVVTIVVTVDYVNGNSCSIASGNFTDGLAEVLALTTETVTVNIDP